MNFHIFYQDESKEFFETYSPDMLVIKILQIIMNVSPDADLNTKLTQSNAIVASLLFYGKGEYPHRSDSPLFTIVDMKP